MYAGLDKDMLIEKNPETVIHSQQSWLVIVNVTQKVISLFPSLPSLVCRHCGGVLRLWPAQVSWDYMIIIGATL